MLIHVVRPGETVYAIARNYGVDPRRLMADNGVPADGALAVGQTLVLRFPNVVHAVRPGETLSAIARNYGVSLRSLWRNNLELLGGSLLAPGQVLLEVKITNAAPLWLARALSENGIFPTSFSKCGRAFEALCKEKTDETEIKRYA